MHRLLGITLACTICSFATPLCAAIAPSATAPTQAKTVEDRRLEELERETGDRPVDSILEQALAYDERGQAARAVELYQQAATQGVGVAELRLGWFNESGTAGEQNYTRARGHYQKAAALGVPEANLRLGLMNLEGWGAPRDVPAAVASLQLAADAGYQPAQQILSQMYFSGTGVTKDLKLALFWAEKAASKQAPESQILVGAIRQKAARLPQEIRAAREWYQLSAEQEYTTGMRAMASTFLKPGANPEEVALGLHWLELASETGDGTASFHLAGIYLWSPHFQSTSNREEKALTLLKLAAQGGELAATEVLALVDEGKPFVEAFAYVLSVPIEERYIQRLAATPPTESEIAAHEIRPRPIKMMQPIYPPTMLLTNTDGIVIVEFIIDSTGRVREARAISSSHQAFADQAVASITAWRFLPGYKDGRAVTTRVQIPVEFKMGEGIGGLEVKKFRAKATSP